MTELERLKYVFEINVAFTPGAPIDRRDLFAGRQRQVERVLGTILQRGQHAVIFGERGVGKTSLANTLFDVLVMAGSYNFQKARLNCAEGMTFESIWRLIFRQLTTQIEGEDNPVSLENSLPPNPTSEDVRETFSLMDSPCIVIIDEIDRLGAGPVQKALADTIKTLSDNSDKATLIMVGVADSVDQLIQEHRSIERALVQVHMQRMSKPELVEIIDKGLSQCQGLHIEIAAQERIADYAHGLPSYVHLLARESALHAVREDRKLVKMEDLEAAIQEAVNSQLETNLNDYRIAVSAPRGINFRPVLLACALAKKDEHGFFYATNVTHPLRLITAKNYGIPAFARHLKMFCENGRGPILERRGKPYRFIRPMMEPYIILRGLADGLISEEQLSRPSMTSTEPEQLSLISPSSAPALEI